MTHDWLQPLVFVAYHHVLYCAALYCTVLYCPALYCTALRCVLTVQVVVEAHFLMRSSTDPDTGALMVSAVQLSLVIADVAMPAAGPLVLDTAFSVQWANATVPDAALQVCKCVVGVWHPLGRRF